MRVSVSVRFSLSLFLFSLFPVLGTGTQTGLGIEGTVGRELRIEASRPRQSQTQVKQRSKRKKIPWLDRPVLATRSPVVSCAGFESRRVESSSGSDERDESSWACAVRILLILYRTVQLVTVCLPACLPVCLSVCPSSGGWGVFSCVSVCTYNVVS